MSEDIYRTLSDHLSRLAVGPPQNDWLVQILRESFSEEEARVLLALPTRVGPLEPAPLEELAPVPGIPPEEVRSVLDRLSGRGLIFKGLTRDGRSDSPSEVSSKQQPVIGTCGTTFALIQVTIPCLAK